MVGESSSNKGGSNGDEKMFTFKRASNWRTSITKMSLRANGHRPKGENFTNRGERGKVTGEGGGKRLGEGFETKQNGGMNVLTNHQMSMNGAEKLRGRAGT